MGQKINPNGIRLGITRQYSSVWYASTAQFSANIRSDAEVRKYLTKELKNAFVSKIVIDRPAKSIRVTICTARPGIVIGKKGEDVETLRQKISAIAGVPAQVFISEIRKPDLDAKLVADSIASQLERRVMFRRAMKKAIQSAMRAGAKGIKVDVSGRLGGAELARSEWLREGRVPLHTLRADIDYALSEAVTTYGVIGVKVWIFKGEVLGELPLTTEDTENRNNNAAPQGRGRRRDDNQARPGRGRRGAKKTEEVKASE